MPSPSLRDAETLLLERRRSQRGRHTLGDDADRTFLAALAALPGSAREDARASGRRVGEHVYSRAFLDDDLPGAVATLSAATLASGAGALLVADAFHRGATVRFDAASALAPAAPEVRDGYAAGLLEGYLATAFNCRALVEPRADGLRVELGDGRDVNRARGRGEA